MLQESLQWNRATSKRNGQKWGRENTTSNWNDRDGFTEQCRGTTSAKTVGKWNNANGYKGQQLVREKAIGKWNDASGFRGQKWSRDKTVNKWKDTDGYKEQSNSKEMTVSKWTNASGCEEQSNAKASNWNDANGYKEQSNRKELSAKRQTGISPIDFESLFRLTRIPQVGSSTILFWVLMHPRRDPSSLTFQNSIEMGIDGHSEANKKIISVKP